MPQRCMAWRPRVVANARRGPGRYRLGRVRAFAVLVALGLVAFGARFDAVAAGPAAEVEIATECGRLAWSGWTIADTGFGFPGGEQEIWVAQADGFQRVAVSRVGDGPDPADNREPVWSPDGTRIAWSGHDGTTRQIYVAAADGTNRITLSAAGPGEGPTENDDPEWSPDGTRIAWSGHDGTTHRIFVADGDGSDRVEISSLSGPPATLVRDGHPAWNLATGRLAWTRIDLLGGAESGIVTSEPDGTGPLTIAVGSDVGLSDVALWDVQWSPDGNWLSWYQQDLSGDVISVIRARADGGLLTNVWSPYLFAGGFHWAPDGSVIAMSESDPKSASFGAEIAVVAMDALREPGDPLPPLLVANATAPQWSPDGSRLAWLTRTFIEPSLGWAPGDGQLIVGAADGSSPRPVSPVPPGGGVSGGAARWRPSNPESCVEVCPIPGTASAFADLDEASPSHRDDIDCIHQLGVTTGTAPSTYSPLEVVTRQQMASFLSRLFATVVGSAAPVVDTPFDDLDTASASHRSDIARIYGLGITTGTTPTSYSPLEPVARQQMASFLARLYQSL